MRLQLFMLVTLAISLASCERSEPVNYTDPVLRIGDDLEYSYNDFELYDSSTHILYFKMSHPEFDSITAAPFILYADTAKIYNGVFWPLFSSSIPTVPYISTWPFFYPDYTLRFQCMEQLKTDLRNDSRLMSAFKNRNILHSGLSVSIKSLIINGSHVSLLFTVKNNDQTDLLILDPDKMGSNLFHYFTNGLNFFNGDIPNIIYCNISPQAPSPPNSWKIEWMTLLKSGESEQFTINYTLDSPLTSGNYTANFEFPGLSHQILIDQLFQSNGRIWLGDASTSKRIAVN